MAITFSYSYARRCKDRIIPGSLGRFCCTLHYESHTLFLSPTRFHLRCAISFQTPSHHAHKFSTLKGKHCGKRRAHVCGETVLFNNASPNRWIVTDLVFLLALSPSRSLTFSPNLMFFCIPSKRHYYCMSYTFGSFGNTSLLKYIYVIIYLFSFPVFFPAHS